MGLLEELKTNKDLQNKILDKLAGMPKLINTVAFTTNVVARMFSPFWFVINSASCKHQKRVFFLHKIVRDSLQDKLKTYMNLMSSRTDSHGFIEHDCCDALLFSGLVGAVGANVDIVAARNEDGAWERRATENPCFPDGSRSTISRDMMLGLLWYIWRNNKLDLAVDLWNYGKKHNWIMGKGDVSRIYLTPGLQATLAEIIYQLGGPNYWVTRNLPQLWTKGLEGYQCHLEVLHILLRGELLGSITSPMRASLADMCTRHVDNHLYTTAKARFSADQSSANFLGTLASIGLENVDMWPRDRLPSDADRSSRWIFENNDKSKGSDPNLLHTGGDLVFTAALIMDYSDILE